LYFAKPDAMQGTLIDTLLWCRPTVFFGVPRVWEKFEDKLKEVAASKPQFL
jgi:long-chain-fatty-acid--CoA ligase ACSBG